MIKKDVLNMTPPLMKTKAAIKKMFASVDWNYAITFNFYGDISMHEAKRKLATFFARIDRKLLGANWSKKALDERAYSLLIAEHGKKSNFLHFHGCLFIPKEIRSRFSLSHAESTWEKIYEPSSLDIREYYKYNWSSYCTKMLNSSNYSDFVFTPEFNY
jgi:hypothetical protein